VYTYFPDKYVSIVEQGDFIDYTEKALVVNIGGQPKDKDFSSLNERTVTLLREMEGINTSVKIVDISKKKVLTEEEHEVIVASRNKVKRISESPYFLLHDREIKIEILEARLRNMTKFIVNYINECTASHICCDDMVQDVTTATPVDSDPFISTYILDGFSGHIEEIPYYRDVALDITGLKEKKLH